MEKVRISFLGDIALVGEYNDLYKKGINPFKEVELFLKKSDFVVGNLECLSEGKDGENYKKRPRLKTELETLNLLKHLNLGLATLAHNHVYDNLLDGFKKTTAFLREKSISYIGAGTSVEIAKKPILKEILGIKFCFLNYVSHDTNPNIPNNAIITPNYFDLVAIKTDIQCYRNDVDQIILLLHWGGRLEGGCYPDFDQPTIAKKLIDYGADIIVGHHSHTLQPYEVYKGKYIFYSLGNFCFADFISDGELQILDKKRRSSSIILNVEFTPDAYKVKFIPIRNKELHIIIDDSINAELASRNRTFLLFKKYKVLWFIYFAKVKYYLRFMRIITRKKNKIGVFSKDQK